MKTFAKSLAVAAILTLAAGAAAAAEQCCCCKEKDGKMACCEDMKQPQATPDGSQQKPAPEHKH